MTEEEALLQKYLSYCPFSGVFTWKLCPGTRVKQGDKAGCIGATGYVQIRFKTKVYKAHRLAWLFMTGKWPPHQIDHKNGIEDDNRWRNLRLATCQQNAMNQAIGTRNKSGVIGICYYKRTGRWETYITVKGKRVRLGTYKTIEEAMAVRSQAELDYGFFEQHGRKRREK